MQIIGCILIAINVGILILIIIFRKRRIGNNNEKYLNEDILNNKNTNQ